MTPILLAPWSRNGSTAVMKILAGSNEILTSNRYPYEAYQLLQFVRAAQTVTGLTPATPRRQADLMPGVWDGTLTPVDGLPFLGSKSLDLCIDILMSLWDGWCNHVKEVEGNAGWRYYAEKSEFEAVELFGRRRSVRLLWVSRDPRDIFLSSRAFNEARSDTEFGWSGEDAAQEARRMIAGAKYVLERFGSLPSNVDRLVLRYDQLVRDPQRFTKTLGDWLGVNLDPGSVKGIKETHRTSKSHAASVDRWRTEMPSSIKKVFSDEGSDVLRELGYAP